MTGAFLAAVLAGAFFAGAFLTGAFLAAVLAAVVVFLAAAAVFAGAAFAAVLAAVVVFLAAAAVFAGAFFAEACAFFAEAWAFFSAARGFSTNALNSAPALNFGTGLAFTLMVRPSKGLFIVRALRWNCSKMPKPLIATFSPLATSALMVSMTASTASAAS